MSNKIQMKQVDSANAQFSGVRHYTSAATNPSSPAPVDGDRYFNTVLEMEMRYDGSRAKWLSVESAWFQVGRDGNTTAGTFYRGPDGRLLSSTIGFVALYNGTVVGFGYTRSDSDAATFDIVAGGTSLATLASSAVKGKSTTLNANFAVDDVLAVKNAAASANTTSDVMAWVRVKWRVT